ncbi:Photosystem I assembly protein [Dirofilaria immitis]
MMNTIEKLDKILRRLSSKNRRSTTRRANCHPEVSSSGSDEGDLAEKQLDTTKNDRKSGNNRRAHLKSIMPIIQNIGTTITITRHSSEKLERTCNLQQQQHQVQYDEQKFDESEHPKIGDTPDGRMLDDNNCETFTSLLSPSTLSNTRMFVDDSVTEANADSAAHDKSCESEDADYVSDYSTCGVQRSATRKYVYELDMSMDESLPESCGRESGYLSGIDVRYSISAAESPALSPLGVALFRTQSLFQRTLETITQQSFDSEESQKNEKSNLKAIGIPRQVSITTDLKLQNEEAKIPDYASTEKLLQDSVAETKYITTIFEFSSGGIVDLIDDILNEFSLWFHEEIGLLGIACEVQWSVPEKHRHLASEKRMKEALHYSLRQNNRRVLNMKSRIGNYHLPLTMTSAITEENCARNCQLNCFQGIYRRFYTSLLPYQHADAGIWHRPYWNFNDSSQPNPSKPNLEQFIFGRDATKLDVGSLVAVNVIALKIVL